MADQNDPVVVTAPAVPAEVVPATTAPEAASATVIATAEAPAPQFDKVGHPAIDLAIDFVSGLGIKADDPAYLAAKDGDFDLLKVKLATMGDKARGWEQVLAVAEKGYGEMSDKAQADADAKTTLIHEVAGGEEVWAEIRDWAKANADDSEKKDLNAMLNAGGLHAKAAVMYLKGLYAGSPDTSQPPSPAVKQTAGSSPAQGSQALSPAEYKAAINELSRKLGPRIDDSPEYAQLKARRAAWRG